MSRIYVIHENDAWVEPLRAAFAALGEPYDEWFLSDGLVDLTQPPPEGVFYNRMSASSHTRGHRYAPELTAAVLALALAALGLMIWTANLGGRIRHPEIGTSKAVPPYGRLFLPLVKVCVPLESQGLEL